MISQYPTEPPREKSFSPYAGRGSIVARSYVRRQALDPIGRLAAANALPPVVYYIRRGDDIKIGHSTNLGARLQGQGGMSALLAIEFGDRLLERKRHGQFGPYLIPELGREVFRAVPELMAHIGALREALGLLPLDDAA